MKDDMPRDSENANYISSSESPLEVIRQLEERGFVHSFQFEDGRLLCPASGKRYLPQELSVEASYRFEGASNPDDSSVLYALTAADGVRGTIMDAFGTKADVKLGEYLKQLGDVRDDSDIMQNVPASKVFEISTKT